MRLLYPKGHATLAAPEEAQQQAKDRWVAIRPERPLLQRMHFQKQKLEKARAKARKRREELDELEAEVLPKLQEAKKLLEAAEEGVQKDEAKMEEMLRENDGEKKKYEKGEGADEAVGQALAKVKEIGPILANIAEGISDDNPCKQELNLVLQGVAAVMGSLQRADGSGNTEVHDMADDDEGQQDE